MGPNQLMLLRGCQPDHPVYLQKWHMMLIWTDNNKAVIVTTGRRYSLSLICRRRTVSYRVRVKTMFSQLLTNCCNCLFSPSHVIMIRRRWKRRSHQITWLTSQVNPAIAAMHNMSPEPFCPLGSGPPMSLTHVASRCGSRDSVRHLDDFAKTSTWHRQWD